MPFFSVIIPTYNRATYLNSALESLLKQSFRDFEIIVVDDGSTDDTSALLARYGDRLTVDSFTVLRQANQGPGSARNLGIKHAQGEYVVFLDSDDLFLPWTLEIYRQTILQHQQPAFLMCRPYRFKEGETFLALSQEPWQVDYWRDYLSAAGTRFPVTIAAAVRKDLLKENGGFLEHNIGAEDQDLFLRLGTAPGFAFIQAPALYGYRQHAALKESKSWDVASMLEGARFVLEREQNGHYAGGAARRQQRDMILARKFRYGVRRCFERGHFLAGYRLFAWSLGYYLRTGHWRELYRLPFFSLRLLLSR